ncbi:hypothetical protein IV102_02850 [bacterium]|nr:hypothetical protein [bacterium]
MKSKQEANFYDDQPFSWVAMEDVLGLVGAALVDDRWQGPVNAVSPESNHVGGASMDG